MRLVMLISILLNIVLVSVLVGILAGSVSAGVAVVILLMLVAVCATYMAWERGALGRNPVAESRNSTGTNGKEGSIPPAVVGSNLGGTGGMGG